MGTICPSIIGKISGSATAPTCMRPKRELFARDAASEIVHQFFFAHRVAFDDARLLALERFAFEHLRNAPPQKIDARFHFLFERIGSAARQGEKARAVRVLEIVHIAAVRR